MNLRRYLTSSMLLQVWQIREAVGWSRFGLMSRLGSTSPRVAPSVDPSVLFSDYSASWFRAYRPVPVRINLLLALVQTCLGVTRKDEVLVVGGRYESEYLGLRGLGWQKRMIYSVDLFSYSPRVLAMDAHHLDFEDRKFSLIMLGWVLPYSKNPGALAGELDRVLRKDGYIVIGLDAIHLDPDREENTSIDSKPVSSVDEVQQLWPGYRVVLRSEGDTEGYGPVTSVVLQKET